ncbi:MAG: hypothetical protein Phyf2KO_12330 [Phycisphaerales bacterium]
MVVWSIDQIADLMAKTIEKENARLRTEDAVLGVDALDETALHPILADGLENAGFGVFRELPFPTPSRRRAKNSERERCDLVLTHEPGLPIVDPVEVDKREHELEGTLFEPVKEQTAKLKGIDPADALWIELKVCGQYEFIAGVPIPNTAYTTGVVLAPATDIRKLGKERAISHALSALVLFAVDEETARHDLQIAVHKWLDKSLPIRSPAIRVVQIDERIGNAVAAVCLTPVRCDSELA